MSREHASDPCPCLSWARDASDHMPTHHPRCESRANVTLWECANCGARAINGGGKGWTAKRDERWHACPGLAERLSPRPAFLLDLTLIEQALLAMIRGMRLWGADTDGIHSDAWDAYVDACRVLGLPKPSEEDAP